MKQRFFAGTLAALVLTAAAAGFAGARHARAAETAALSARSAYAIDAATGSVVYANNETERRPVASMVKIMTLLLACEEIDAGRLSPDEKVAVSEYAASMGGSQAFLDAGSEHTVDALLRSIAVASANDSCVAIAERVAGSVEGFVSRMNARAAELGMFDTLFTNCTGLPGTGHYSCAKDVAAMTRALLAHPRYFDYAGTWMYDFQHPSGRVTGLTNTNRMIRTYRGCDGGKTGFTNEAGFCVSATAKRGDLRLISVVMGERDSKTRFADAAKLLDHGFANFKSERVVTAGTDAGRRDVPHSKQGSVATVYESDVNVFTAVTDAGEIGTKTEWLDVKAPLKKGDRVGTLYVARDGAVVGETAILAAEDAPRRTLWDTIVGIAGAF